jgi:hypothetical protein
MTGTVVAAGADVGTAGVGVDEMLQANNRMEKIVRGYTSRFINSLHNYL